MAGERKREREREGAKMDREGIQNWVASRKMLFPSDLTGLGMGVWVGQKCRKDNKDTVNMR